MLLILSGCLPLQSQPTRAVRNATPDGTPIARNYGELRAHLDAPDPDLDRAEEALKQLVGKPTALLAEFKAATVWPECDGEHSPCGMLARVPLTPAHLAEFSENVCAEKLKTGQPRLSDRCSDMWVARFEADVERRYSLAESESIRRTCKDGAPQCRSLVGYELLWLASHNEAAKRRFETAMTHFEQERRVRLQAYEDALRTRQQRRQRLIDAFEEGVQERQELERQEQQEADRRRRALAAMSAGFASMSQSTSAPYTTYSPPTGYAPTMPAYSPATSVGVTTPSRKGCSSDYDCQYGSRCLKGFTRTQGTCAQSVNEFGTPTFAPPSPNSIMPGGDGDCSWDTECPIGFQCRKPLGQIKGHCLK
jgi:hypothetical protein